MRNLICILLTCHLLTSCVTQQKCLERFPPKEIRRDSVVTVIRDSIVHDTIIIPGESLSLMFDLGDTAITLKKEVKRGRMTAGINIVKGKVTVDCKADSLMKIIELKEKIIETYRSMHVIEIPKAEIIYKVNWYDMAFRYGFFILLFIILLLLAGRYVSAWLKTLL